MSDNVQPHEIDYKHGHCDAFAWAVHHITHWPIVKFAPNEHEDAHHWVCEIPSSTSNYHEYFDVDGPHDPDDILEYYALHSWEINGYKYDPEMYDYHSDIHELENYNSDEKQGDYSTKNMGKIIVPYARQKLREHGFNF